MGAVLQVISGIPQIQILDSPDCTAVFFHHGNFSHFGIGQVYASILKFQSLWIGSWWLQTLDKWFYCKHILILWIPLPVLVAQVIAVIRFWTWRMHILWLTIFWGANCCGPYVGLWESQLNQLVFLHKKNTISGYISFHWWQIHHIWWWLKPINETNNQACFCPTPLIVGYTVIPLLFSCIFLTKSSKNL